VVSVADDAGHVIEAERTAHAYARERGFSRPLYAVIRALARAVLRTWFRVRVSGAEHIPADGGVIVAPNHKNFLDPFFIGIVARRHVRFMAKIELFKGPLAWLFTRLGAFPIRRSESDTEALDTAAAILRAGGLVVVFPEGTARRAARRARRPASRRGPPSRRDRRADHPGSDHGHVAPVARRAPEAEESPDRLSPRGRTGAAGRRSRSRLGADRRSRVARGSGGVRSPVGQTRADRRRARRNRRRRWAAGQTPA
jgi:1-acyl-sn-glycerol-3-phosphate acyltransferase